jgi:uncharacterized membrane protein HdeD (DUF308 family)
MSANRWLEQAHKNAGWLVALGIAEMVLGVFVLFVPLAGGRAVMILIGLAIMIGGIIRLIVSFAGDSFGSGALSFLWGLVIAVAGFFILTHPDVGLATLTLVLSIMFFLSGLLACIVAFEMKGGHGWGWMLAGGILLIILAIMIWRQFPLSGAWLVGILVGIGLLSNGLTTLMVGILARKVTAPG